MPQLDRRELLQLCVLALGLRFAVALLWAPAPSGDAVDYLRLAEELAGGRGFVDVMGNPTSWRPPLYAAFLAPFVRLLGANDLQSVQLAARIAQALLSTGSVLLVYVIGTTWFGRTTGRVAGVLVATSLVQVAAVSRILSETLFVFLFLVALALLGAAVQRRDPTDDDVPRRSALFALAGACFGLATLVRGALLPFPFVVASCMVGRAVMGRNRASVLTAGRQSILLMLGFVTVLGPWSIRNYGVHGEVVPLATQGGATLYAGNHPEDGYILGKMAQDSRTLRARSMSEVEASRYLTSKTLEDWFERPKDLTGLIALKLLYFWTPADWEVLPGSGAFNPTYAFILFWAALAVAAGVSDRWRPARGLRGAGQPTGELTLDDQRLSQAWVVWAPVIYFVTLALVFYGSPRLRMPIEPLLCLMAAVGLLRSVGAIGAKKSALAASCVIVLTLGLGAAWGSIEAAVVAVAWGGA